MAVSCNLMKQEIDRTQDASDKMAAFHKRIVSCQHCCRDIQFKVMRIPIDTLSETAKGICQELRERIVETNGKLLDRIHSIMKATINFQDESNQLKRNFVQCVTQQQDHTGAQRELHTFVTDMLKQNGCFEMELHNIATEYSQPFTGICTDIITVKDFDFVPPEPKEKKRLFVKTLDTLEEHTKSLKFCLTLMDKRA